MASLNFDQDLLKRLVLDEGKLHDVLYGRWVEWGGRRPPTYARQKLLQNIPKDILKVLPSEVFLDVSTLCSARIGVFASTEIEEKTVIGPLPGRHVDFLPINDKENTWEILDDTGCVTSYLCTADPCTGSWMGLIQCARYAEEQNMEMFQENSSIYYRVIKHIQIGEELLAWYGIQVPQCLGIPHFEPDTCKNINLKNEAEPGDTCLVDEERKKVKCVLCHKGFNSRSNLRSHMRTHTNQKPFRCSTCGRRFSQSSTLRNHIRLHTGEKPYKCSFCKCAYSQLAGLRAHQKSSQHRPKKNLNSTLTTRD